MARSLKGQEFWSAVVAEARAGGASHKDIAAKHGVTEAALKYHFYRARKQRPASKRVEMLPVRVGDRDARQIVVELGASLCLRFAEGCDPAYVAALVAKLR